MKRMDIRPLRCVHHRAQPRGFAAISAVFLLVVLAGLGAYMLSLSNVQQMASAQDVLGTRAYWAARAGLDWGMASASAQCPMPGRFELDGFTVQVSCSQRTFIDGPETVSILTFESQATNNAAVGSAAYVERSLSASRVMN
jgi:MSHA biogenesis protein MshP